MTAETQSVICVSALSTRLNESNASLMLELETGIPGGIQKNWEGTSSIQPAHLGRS